MAVLQRLGANEDLFALVFGESCLNDAVGIVLYRTMSMFLHRRVTAGSVFIALFSFLGVFLGSVLIGELMLSCSPTWNVIQACLLLFSPSSTCPIASW